VNTLLIHSLPFRNPERLVWLANHEDATGDMSAKTSQVDHFLDLRETISRSRTWRPTWLLWHSDAN